MKKKKKSPQIQKEIVTDMKMLNRNPKLNKEIMKEKSGSSTINRTMHTNTESERYSSTVILSPDLFKSDFRSGKNFVYGCICLPKRRMANFT